MKGIGKGNANRTDTLTILNERLESRYYKNFLPLVYSKNHAKPHSTR